MTSLATSSKPGPYASSRPGTTPGRLALLALVALPILIFALGLAALGAINKPARAQTMTQPKATPAVVVRIDVVPGGTEKWVGLFEAHMAPAIREAIEAGDEIVDFAYYEALVPSQSTDVVLILRAETFAFFDERRPFPHYRALFRRLGPEEGGRVLGEMTALERSVEVALVRSFAGTQGGL